MTDTLGPYELNTIVTGDARELAKAIPDESVDLILCDPVYQEIWQYEWVAQQAARVLKPGRSLITQCGHIHRFEAEMVMHNVQGLVHRPLLEEVFTGGFGRNWMHKSLRTSQPYLWFTRADDHPYDFKRQYHQWVKMAFYGAKDKAKFVWGDGERAFYYLLETFTRPGDLVLDPFAGTGTVGAACIGLGRLCVGFELDAERAAKAQRRLAGAQQPLFVMERQELAI